ncbi:MAG: hypothetical protein IT343_04660 [Candidatus Melainabacteria bacterium]|jgi:hypothetical protein|nr:hypothetical protein [Candidatus Melainabacteria bacterium]
MCCSAWPITFSRTITGTWEVLVEDRLMHVLLYQNRIGKPKYSGSWAMPGSAETVAPSANQAELVLPEGEGNCLVIPLMGHWQSIRLLNTFDTPNLLEDISKAIQKPVMRSSMPSLGAGGWGGSGGGLVFLKFDIYDIVIAENARDIPLAIEEINPLKRPEVNTEVFSVLDEWYRCPVAVCCFNNVQSGDAKPLAFAFEPLYPDTLVVYTLDGHDGKPPAPNEIVNVDHDIFVGSYLMKSSLCATVKYTDEIPDHLQPYILNKVLGVKLQKQMENGDFVFQTEHVRRGLFQGLRALPPFAPSGIRRLGHLAVREESYTSFS